MTELRKNMPQGYLKRVNDVLDRPMAYSTIKRGWRYPERNKALTEALAWVAMENILGKMLQMPNM